MGIKSLLSIPFATWIASRVAKDCADPIGCQEHLFHHMMSQAGKTSFGHEHGLDKSTTYQEFREKCAVGDYEHFKPYIDRITAGEIDVLWPGKPRYFAKTSGTTSGVKYIPVTRESLRHQIKAARNALLLYIHATGNSRFTDHKMIFLQGSPVLEKHGAIATGRLSGIVAHCVPGYLQKNRLPRLETNCIEDWETKVDKIVEETITERMSLISGIPSWLRMYFEKLVLKSGKKVGDLFPDLQLIVYGGVNFEPYRTVFDDLIGRKVDTIELFPASEGFFAYQDLHPGNDMLLNVNGGIFYEFIPVSRNGIDNHLRIPLQEVVTGVDYALIITTDAGLYAYSIGDTVQFTSLRPYRIRVTGRTAQFLSTFGEHVIASEAEGAIAEALATCGGSMVEFTLAPHFRGGTDKPCHQWLIEFAEHPSDIGKLQDLLNETLCARNIYYKDLIDGNVLGKPVVTQLAPGSFDKFMKEKGMLGGQNKVPHLADNRLIADALLKLQQTGSGGSLAPSEML